MAIQRFSTVQITVQSSLKINSTTLSTCDPGGPFASYLSDVSGGDGNYSGSGMVLTIQWIRS